MKTLKVFPIFGLIFSVSIANLTGCRSSLSSDKDAVEAVNALKKLEAKIETGMTEREYSSALGETNFAVKMFLESPEADKFPEFSQNLRTAMKWDVAADDIWQRKIDTLYFQGYCHPPQSGPFRAFAQMHRDATGLCEKYPELVITFPGLGNSETQISGLEYTIAEWESWNRAAHYTKNAQHLLRGEVEEALDESSFKITEEQRHSEILNEAKQALGR
jgi:hypothetical protein